MNEKEYLRLDHHQIADLCSHMIILRIELYQITSNSQQSFCFIQGRSKSSISPRQSSTNANAV